MVKVVYHRDLNRVTVEGHAKSGEIGQDLVCASVSSLVYALASFVLNMKSAGQVYNPRVELKAGDTLICCAPPNKYKNSVTLVFDAICGGFQLLARDYPDNISYEVIGKSI